MEIPENHVSPEEKDLSIARRKVKEELARIKDTFCQMRTATFRQQHLRVCEDRPRATGYLDECYPVDEMSISGDCPANLIALGD